MNVADLSVRLADSLERGGLIDARLRAEVEKLTEQTGVSFEMALYQVEALPPARLRAILEEVTGVTCVDPSLMNLTPDFIRRMQRLVDPRVLVSTKSFPTRVEGNYLHIAFLARR